MKLAWATVLCLVCVLFAQANAVSFGCQPDENGCEPGYWSSYGTCQLDGATGLQKRCKNWFKTYCISAWGSTWNSNSALGISGDQIINNCMPFGQQQCTTSGCQQGCDGTYTEYGACTYNIFTGKTQKCRLFTPSGGSSSSSSTSGNSSSGSNGGGSDNCDEEGGGSNVCNTMRRRNLQAFDPNCPKVDCTSEGCPQLKQDCEGSFSMYGDCQYDSQAHANKRCRSYHITQHATFGGLGCPYENGDQECHTGSCNQPKDCVGSWTQYSQCTKKDDGFNHRCRSFVVAAHPQDNGKPCDWLNNDKECTTLGCNQPKDCVGSFTDYGECKTAPGGSVNKKCRTFKISQSAAFGGQECVMAHNQQQCSTVDCPQAQDCEGYWSMWGHCNMNTLTGKNERTRSFHITQPALNGGLGCPYSNGQVQTQSSNCSQPVDCVGSWSETTGCTYYALKHQVMKTLTYTISTEAVHGGAPCKFPDGTTQQELCPADQQPVDCVGHWGPYGQCDAVDKSPIYRRSLQQIPPPQLDVIPTNVKCRKYHVDVPASNNGKSCPYFDNAPDCTSNGCDQKVNCVGSYGFYSSCHYNPLKHENRKCKTYSITTQAEHGGSACPIADGHVECITGGCVQPVDCEYKWNTDECKIKNDDNDYYQGDYVQDRRRSLLASDLVKEKCSTFEITTQPSHSGEACPHNTGYKTCTTEGCAQPVDCVGHWELSSQCSYEGGSHSNKKCETYKITVPGGNGGKACPHEDGEKNCFQLGCPQPVDCEDAWAIGFNCVYDPETKSNRKTSTYHIIKMPENNGKACPYVDGYTQSHTMGCIQPINCQGVWSSYGSCKYSPPNADGSSKHANERCKIYKVGVQATLNGEECPHADGKTSCTTGGCVQPVDCKFEWFDVLPNENLIENGVSAINNQVPDPQKLCKVDALSGTSKRCKRVHITVPALANGAQCPHPEGYEECTEDGCDQPQNCVGAWFEDNECKYDPETHTYRTSKTYKVTTASENGGFMCPYPNNYKTYSTAGCSQPVDCSYDWSPYTYNAPKGNGPSGGGGAGSSGSSDEDASYLNQMENILRRSLQSDGYGECFKDALTGANKRCKQMKVITEPTLNGNQCPFPDGHLDCTQQGCGQPVSCVGEWSSYSPCAWDEAADANKRCKTYGIDVQAANGGEACKFDDGVTFCTTAGCGQPVDCEYEWTAFGTCNYYESTKSNKRCRDFNVTTVPDMQGEQCPYPQGYTECVEDGCPQPVDCEGGWEEYESCFYDGLNHQNKRCRRYKVYTEPVGYCAQCPHQDGETQCTIGGCDQPVDCSYSLYDAPSYNNDDLGEFGNDVVNPGYGSCVISNGVSKQCAYVGIITEPLNNGYPCPFPDGYQTCVSHNCTQPVNCEGEWEEYSSCSYNAGKHENKRCRKYNVTQEALHGGATCPIEDGYEQCTVGGCEQPVDCSIDWTPWSTCELVPNPSILGSGFIRQSCRRANVVHPAEFNGLDCGYTQGQNVCVTDTCKQPVDCVGGYIEDGLHNILDALPTTPIPMYSNNLQDSLLNNTCVYDPLEHANVKCSVYKVFVPASEGGVDCPNEDGFRHCSKMDCPQPMDCKYAWNFIDDEDSTNEDQCHMTETGERKRCKSRYIASEATHNGKPCDGTPKTVCTKNGCNQPVACEGSWSEYGTCAYDIVTHDNKRCRTYKVTKDALFGGEQCPHVDGEEQCIVGGCQQPVECEFSWSDKSDCKYNPATKSNEWCRTVSITQFPSDGGLGCPYENGYKQCSKDNCAQPTACKGSWSAYDTCVHDVETDVNKRCKTYTIEEEAANGGEACKFDDGVTSCTTAGCGQPVDCESEWSAYGTCNFYSTSKSNKRCRTYNVTTVPDFNGEQCTHDAGYTECTEEGCAQPVDCQGAWQEYESCMYEPGTHMNRRCRVYKVSVEAAYGGETCPHNSGKTECTIGGCNQPVDCEGAFGAYSEECLFNSQLSQNEKCRTYDITTEAKFNGKQCPHLQGELQCSTLECAAPVGCVGSWSEASSCFYDSDSGSNMECRTYEITSEAQHNGEACPHAQGEKECKSDSCAQPVDCVGSWEEYGECTFEASEHENKKCRKYKITTAAAAGGQECSIAHDTEECTSSTCAQPVDCVGSFSDIGTCSYDASGHQNKACKVFSIEVEAANGGASCEFQNNYEQCTTSVCDQPVDCVGEFVVAPNCTLNADTQEYQSCGTYRIVTPAAHGGNTCGYADGHEKCEPCAADMVPVDCESKWVATEEDQCATNGVIRKCDVFTVTQQPNAYGEQCAHAEGYELCRTEECEASGSGDSSNQDGSNDGSKDTTGSSSLLAGGDSEKKTSTASTTDALMYAGIGLAALLLCCLPLCCCYYKKKQKKAGLGQQVEGRKYSLLAAGNGHMVPMPVGNNTTMMQNPFFGAGDTASRSKTMDGGVTFNSNPLGEDDTSDAQNSGFETTTEYNGRGSMQEGFFNPMFTQESQEEAVGSLQQNMYAMYDYIDQMCAEDTESMAFGEIKKDMQEAMISWTQVEESLIDSEGQVISQNVTNEDMEEKLKQIRQKLNKIEQSAFMCRDINSDEKSSLSNMINNARGKLRRVSCVGGPGATHRKTTMPTEWKQIKMKLKTVKALRGN